MHRSDRLMVVMLIIAGLQLSGCTQSAETKTKAEPAKVELLAGTNLNRVVLTARAAERLGIATAPVRELSLTGSGAPRKVVPYSSLLYDPNGDTYVYTNPEPLAFVRHPVTVDYIEGDRAVLSDGPDTGTPVVTAGAAELFGVEIGFGK